MRQSGPDLRVAKVRERRFERPTLPEALAELVKRGTKLGRQVVLLDGDDVPDRLLDPRSERRVAAGHVARQAGKLARGVGRPGHRRRARAWRASWGNSWLSSGGVLLVRCRGRFRWSRRLAFGQFAPRVGQGVCAPVHALRGGQLRAAEQPLSGSGSHSAYRPVKHRARGDVLARGPATGRPTRRSTCTLGVGGHSIEIRRSCARARRPPHAVP